MVRTSISHYKVIEKIGEGGMGEVFFGRILFHTGGRKQ